MKQRIVIAMALAGEPDLIVADEPTTALDVTVQAQIIHILGALVSNRGLALMFITHDMGVVAQILRPLTCSMRDGWPKKAPSRRSSPACAIPIPPPLIGCIPRTGPQRARFKVFPAPCPRSRPTRPAAAISPRCTRADAACQQVPPLQPQGQGLVACHHAGDGA